MSKFKTPSAAAHDARVLADHAQGLIDATAEITDQKVAEARKRVISAIDSAGEALNRVADKTIENAKAADRYVQENPWKCAGIAFGAGALTGWLLFRRR